MALMIRATGVGPADGPLDLFLPLVKPGMPLMDAKDCAGDASFKDPASNPSVLRAIVFLKCYILTIYTFNTTKN